MGFVAELALDLDELLDRVFSILCSAEGGGPRLRSSEIRLPSRRLLRSHQLPNHRLPNSWPPATSTTSRVACTTPSPTATARVCRAVALRVTFRATTCCAMLSPSSPPSTVRSANCEFSVTLPFRHALLHLSFYRCCHPARYSRSSVRSCPQLSVAARSLQLR